MTTKSERHRPMWGALRRRDALEQAERRDRRQPYKAKVANDFEAVKHLRKER